MVYYVQPHISQLDPPYPKSGEGCVPASVANGVAAQSGGRMQPSAQSVHSLIPKSQETDPNTAGWSMVDADHAMAKLGVAFEPNRDWANIVRDHGNGLYLVIQGDSDRFSDATCSGKFDGDHCIGVSPKSKIEGGVEWWWIDDPICKTGRWEKKTTVKAYAEKLATRTGRPVLYGRFTAKVPQIPVPVPPQPPVTLRYGGVRLTPRQVKRIRVVPGKRAKVRRRPDRIWRTDVVGYKTNGQTFTAYQKTQGARPPGATSRLWFGDSTGTRWLHRSAF